MAKALEGEYREKIRLEMLKFMIKNREWGIVTNVYHDTRGKNCKRWEKLGLVEQYDSHLGADYYCLTKEGEALLYTSLLPKPDKWEPTHQHYKGGFYRMEEKTAIAADIISEGSIVTIYENEKGQRFVRSTKGFHGEAWKDESLLGTKRVKRFTPVEEKDVVPSV